MQGWCMLQMSYPSPIKSSKAQWAKALGTYVWSSGPTWWKKTNSGFHTCTVVHMHTHTLNTCTQNNSNKFLEGWRDGSAIKKAFAAILKAQVQFLAPTQKLVFICNSSSIRDPMFLSAIDPCTQTHIPTGRHTHTHNSETLSGKAKIKKIKFKRVKSGDSYIDYMFVLFCKLWSSSLSVQNGQELGEEMAQGVKKHNIPRTHTVNWRQRRTDFLVHRGTNTQTHTHTLHSLSKNVLIFWFFSLLLRQSLSV